MKRLLLLSTLIVTLALSGFQAHASTRLHIASYDNAPIVVYINGVEYGPFSNRHKLAGIPAGVHNMRIVALYANPYNPYNTQRTIYNGPVNLPYGYEVQAIINPYNQLEVGNMVALAPEPVNVGGGVICAYPVGYPVEGHPVQYPVHQPPMVYPMHDAAFADLLNAIRSRPFDSTKKQIASQAIASQYFTSSQVLQMLHLFSFESGRLEIAKMAYTKTLDPERYYVVFEAFSFDSSVRNLSNYMASL